MRMRALFPIAFVLTAACGSNVSEQPCTPGHQVACTCTDGKAGAQTCKADGSGYAACVCNSSGSGGSGGSGGNGGSGGSGTGGTGGAAGTQGPWSLRFGDIMDAQMASGVALDSAADVMVVGAFPGTADFGGGALTSSGPNDIFLAELSPAGHHLWSKHFTANAASASLAPAPGGDVVLAVGATGILDLGGGPLPGQDMWQDLVVARLDGSGKYRWGKRWPVPNMNVYPTAVSTTPQGDVGVVAMFQGVLDVGCGPISPKQNLPNSALVAALSGADGKCLWSTSIAGDTSFVPDPIASDAAGNRYVAGAFNGAADLGGGALLTSGRTLFLVKYAPDGTRLYARTWKLGSASSGFVTGVATDAAGDAFITGSIGGSNTQVDFGTGPIVAQAQSTAFVAKLDPDGNGLWAHGFGPGITTGTDVAIAPSGDVVFSGKIQGAADFGTGSIGGPDGVYVARFTSAGAAVHADAFAGGTTARVALDGLGHIVLAGGFAGTIDLGSGMLTSAGGADGYVAALGH